MNRWRALPDDAWSFSSNIVVGSGGGIGNYRTAYAIEEAAGKFLNGRMSVEMRFGSPRPTGGGIICRGNDKFSFVALYLTTDNKRPDFLSLRLAAFKEGVIRAVVAHKSALEQRKEWVTLAIQFFSGTMSVSALVGDEGREFEYLLPELPFPGYCGLVKFYGAGLKFRNMHIERLGMKPKLPDRAGDLSNDFRYDVFISHASRDKESVMRVVAAFKEAGITYWVDHENITFGDPIVSKIEEGLQNSRFVVVCLSDNLGQSNWSRAEYGPILYREFSGNTGRKVIPLKIDNSLDTKIPLLLSDKMRADFADRSQFGALVQFLVQARQDRLAAV